MPIINPFIIYLFQKVEILTSFILGIGMLITMYEIAPVVLNRDFQYEEKEVKEKTRKAILRNLIVGVFVMFLASLIPDKQTIAMMYSTKYVTVENVQIGAQVIEKVYNDVFTLFTKQEKK